MSGRANGDGRMSGRAAWLCEAVLVLDFEPPGEDQALVFEAPGGRIFAARPGEALRAEVEARVTDLRTFLREGPARWDAPTRTRLLGFLASLGTEFGLSHSLAEGLGQAREALRERRPLSVVGPGTERALEIERLHRIDERRFYVRGRAWEEAGPPMGLNAISPEGELVGLRELLCPGIDTEGSFAGSFETSHPSRGTADWVFEAVGEDGRGVETTASISPDPLRTIFADAALELPGASDLRERHVRPAVTRLNQLRRERAEIAELTGHGRPPRSPEVSLVVPLQRRVDLIEHQLAQFAADPEVGECELLYVLDEPEQSELLRELAAELFPLYSLPFRMAVISEAAGLAIACDLGASLARADRLVFLGADVVPDRPGWLGTLAAALDGDPTVAAATPKLLHPDGTIDQAGLQYAPSGPAREARLLHRLRGMHRDLDEAAEPGRVAAAGLSCLMVEANALAAAGGLRGEYGLADYEGADLSLRLAEAGREVHYVPQAELFRLEGLGAEPEPLGEPYARWLHSRLWAEPPVEVPA